MTSPTNPYIAGNPITGTEMFFGRQDVFRFVRETLVGRYQDNAIVLYGGRRTGKTSVLYQMGHHLAPRYVPVFVDLQSISLDGLGEMLWGIARRAARALHRQRGIKLSVPSRDEFADDPAGCFREGFLDPALQALGDDHLLLMLDEAARLYEQVRDDRLEPRVFDLLRSLIQHHPRLNFIFSIGSGLEEMRQEYALLFNVCQYKKISFLDRDAAEALITEPVKEHYLYTPQAVERILEVTHGHPYYTQLVCNRLFARWAHQRGDKVIVSDVDAVLGEAAEQGMASLQYSWEEVSDTAKVVLAALAERTVDGNQPVSRNDLQATIVAQDIPLSRRAVSRALRELVTREVLRPDDGSCVFTVDLMRLWVQQYQRLEWVKDKFAPPEEAHPPAGQDWVRTTLVGISGGLFFLLVGLSLIVLNSVQKSRESRWAEATAMSGTISALETALATSAGGDQEPRQTLEAQLAVFQTQSAEDQATQRIPTSTPRPTDTPLPTETPSPTAMPTSTSTPTPVSASIGVTWTRPVDEMTMVYVLAGGFEMGSNSDAVDYALQLCNEYLGDCKQELFRDEQPAHTVALDGFWIDQTEVTNAQYRRCVEARACDPPVESSSTTRDSYYGDSTYDGYPVIWVTWHQAAAYCEWAGARLPTEAEWEYAARGSDRRMYPWGNAAPDCDKANYLGKDGGCVGDTTAVGSYPAGASWCNTLDMAGNVWEWVADWYDFGYYDRSPSRNPAGPSSGEYRVLRGGSRYDAAYVVRSVHRYGYLPDNANNDVGFRCARGSE